MSNFIFRCALSLIALTGYESEAYANQDNRLLDLELIYNIFNTQYAPKEWKEDHLGWDLEKEYQTAHAKITANPQLSSSEFHDIIRNFIRSSQDYHVSCQFSSTEGSRLPFSVKSANGRYFVYSIDEKKMDSEIFPISIGDELLTIEDKPVDEVAKSIISKIGLGAKRTDQAIADFMITDRFLSHGTPVPKGPVNLKFLDKKSGRLKTYQMVWHYHPEYVTFHRKKEEKKKKKPLLHDKMIAPKELTDIKLAGKKHLFGDKYSDIPPLGKIVWENPSENEFEAYIYLTPDGEHVGFLRIPDYMPIYEDDEDEDAELVTIMKKFEESASCLVIDQRNNPGGSLDCAYSIASFFAEKPLATPKHKVMMQPELIAYCRLELELINQIHDKEDAKAFLEDCSYSVKPSLHLVNMIKETYEFFISEWEAGKTLSGPIFLQGVDRINPHPKIVFTKPVLVLINELSMSCGDIFPAIMQDNKRAVIMGTRTTGAGGAVVAQSLLNNDGIRRMSYTVTLLERGENRTKIENLGVTPDVEYKVSEYDLQHHHKGYKNAILDVLRSLPQP
jgi:hypothetical protein